MSKYAEIRSNYVDEDEGMVFIDAWYTDDDNEEGEVIAKVSIKTKKVEYLDKSAKSDDYAQEVINEVIEDIDKGEYDYE